MFKSTYLLVVTIILSASGVEPKAMTKDPPYPPSGLRPKGKAFNLPGEEEFVTTTESYSETTTQEDYTTTESPEGVNRLGKMLSQMDQEGKLGVAEFEKKGKLEIVYAIPDSESSALESEEATTTILPDDEVTTFAPIDSSKKCIECKAGRISSIHQTSLTTPSPDDEGTTFKPGDQNTKCIEDSSKITKLYPIDESKVGHLRISDEEIEKIKKNEETEEKSSKTGGDIIPAPTKKGEFDDFKSQTENIEPEEISAKAKKLAASNRKENFNENSNSLMNTGEDLVQDESIESSEKIILDPFLPPETKYSRFYLVNDGKLGDYEYIHQHNDDLVYGGPLVIPQREILVPVNRPFVYSAQIQRLA